jgi:Protein of unknown function (DUF3047)
LRAVLLVALVVGAAAITLLVTARLRSLPLSGRYRGGASSGMASVGAPLPPGAATPAALARIPVPDAAGRVRVPVADPAPARLPAPGVPLGWEMTEFSGSDASVEVVRSDGQLAVRLRSERNSFAVHRDLVLDVRQYPVLSWSWKVVRLPDGADVRETGRNDQAAQVYLIFPRWPSPRTSSDVLGYVWDSRAPVGTTMSHPEAPNVKIMVLQSGPDQADTWLRERRNVIEDYQALFGRLPPRAGKIALMIDSNDTRSGAEALFGELTFSRPDAPEHTEIPTTMLR